MCIAIVKPAGTSVSEDVLKTCFTNNPDGAGFAYLSEQGMVVEKGLFTWEAFIDAYRARGVDALDALVHFRITTKGDDAAENTHPFATNHGALIHNGTIGHLGDRKGKGKSDTRELAEKWEHASFDDMERYFDVFEHYVDDTRVAFMSHSGRVLVFNKSQWIEKDGVLYSNRGFEMDVYGWTAHRNSWGKPRTALSLATLDDDDEYGDSWGTYLRGERAVSTTDDARELEAYERAAVWLEGAADGEWLWMGGFLFAMYDKTVVRDVDSERDIYDEFRRQYGYAAQPGSSDDSELELLTDMYADNNWSFDFDDIPAANAA